MTTKDARNGFEPEIILGRMRFIAALRRRLEQLGYQEVETPLLQRRLSGFEKGTGFSTFSASLGERLWLRAAPELDLKRLIILGQRAGMDRIYEMAICLRDEHSEHAPADSFDRPEFTLLELYSCQDDPWVLEGQLRQMVGDAVEALKASPAGRSTAARRGGALLTKPWRREELSSLVRRIDGAFDLEAVLAVPPHPAPGRGRSKAQAHAQAIAARANDAALREAAASLAYKSGNMARYLRSGPQGYWYDLLDHAFQTKVAPTLRDPVIVHRLPLESSPMAESADGVHCEKWELYVSGVRVALAQRELMDAAAQRVRFEHLDRLRRQGYDILPEPDEGFVSALEQWPARKPLIGMGVYVDRLAAIALGIFGPDGRGQERMKPNLFKG